MELIFATANKHKLEEAQAILGPGFTLITPASLGVTGEIPETAETLEENALMKAEYLWNRFHKPCFADDTGLLAEALGGRPGVYSARFAGPEADPQKNMSKLLSELKGCTNKKARFETVAALILSPDEQYLFKGILEGEIVETPAGSGGFGYDPVFVPEGYDKTLAEITPEEKNNISHRGKAMRKLSDFLNNRAKS